MKVLAIASAILILAGWSPARAQMADMPHDHGAIGDHPDGAFHRRFDDAEKWAKEFDNPERDAWQRPEEVLDALRLPPGAVVADLGAGTGYFSVRLAKRLPQGKVLAADVESDMVRYLGERAKSESLANIVPVQSAADDAKLPEPADLIVVVDTYHHIGHRRRYFEKLKASLRPGGRLAIVDFRANSPKGPPPAYRLSTGQVIEELSSAGYALDEEHTFLPWQYILVFHAS